MACALVVCLLFLFLLEKYGELLTHTLDWLLVLHVQEVSELIELFNAFLFESHLSPYQLESQFQLVSLFEEPERLLELNLTVMHISVVTDSDFFYVLGFLGFVLALFPIKLVLVLSVVQNFGHGRLSGGRNENQVQL